ncbi:MAG TPA: glycerol-3-phosphate 1-O-acyltransferase PlsY [Chthoniobacterales bacterium]|jgi:glycerol-3-phosphate acyltransferase PlsY
MTSPICYVSASLIGYLLGSCPNGFLIAANRGIDIRTQGSGNIGATNVLRVLGKGWGYLVFSLDCLKGLLSVVFAFWIATYCFSSPKRELVGIAAGVACVFGHTFPIWLRFRGGKGVATSAGVLLGLMPLAVISVLVVWVILFKLTRYVSIASVAAASSLPIFVAIYLEFNLLTGASLLPFSLLIATVVVWRHRSNLERLLRGQEQRFGEK